MLRTIRNICGTRKGNEEKSLVLIFIELLERTGGTKMNMDIDIF